MRCWRKRREEKLREMRGRGGEFEEAYMWMIQDNDAADDSERQEDELEFA